MHNDCAGSGRALDQTAKRSHLWRPPRISAATASIDAVLGKCMGLESSATAKQKFPARAEGPNFRSFRGLQPLILGAALALSGCGDKPAQQAAPAPPPVTVAQPTKRTVTDWDEFTGRFEAVEEVQV